MFQRNCPKCGKTINYKTNNGLIAALSSNLNCRSCAQKKHGSLNSFYGKKHTKESCDKMKATRSIIYKNKENAKKWMSRDTNGKKNPMFGRTVYSIWLEKYGKEEADKRKLALAKKHSFNNSGAGNPMFGKPAPKTSGVGWQGYYKGHYFRSLLELSYIVNVLEPNKSKWVSAEFRELSVSYIDEKGSERRYNADFLVDGKIIVEVKPIELQNTILNQIKRKAMEAFCTIKGWSYKMEAPRLLNYKELKTLIENGSLIFNEKTQRKYLKNISQEMFVIQEALFSI